MASSKAGTATVTIHRGELAQIRSQIENHRDSKKPAKGQLYGLWTHSFQPVIQIVVGLPESSKSSAKNQEYKEFFSDNYGLCLLGEWLGAKKGSAHLKPALPEFKNPKRYVNIVFGLEDKEPSVMRSVVRRGGDQHDEEGKLEILPGQSSFRLCENLINTLKLKEAIDVSEEDRAAESGDVREAEVKENQWYSTENGMEILKSLFQILPKKFEVLETSRSTETHNIGFSLKYRMQGLRHGYTREVNLRLEFPANFPQSEITLFCGDQILPVAIDHDSDQQPEEFSQIICVSVMSAMDEYFKPRPEKAGRQRAEGHGSRTNAANGQRGKSRDIEEIEKKAIGKEEEQIHQDYTQDDEKQTTNQDSGVTPVEEDVQSTSKSSTEKTDDSSQIGETEGQGRFSDDIGGGNSVRASGNADGHTIESPVGYSADAPPQGGFTGIQFSHEPMDTSTD